MDRVDCNPLCELREVEPPILSVSALGSSRLQARAASSRTCRSGTFSILSWIERLAKTNSTQRLAAPASFQYPLSDRASCNQERTYDSDCIHVLSVSAFGSSILQHCTWCSCTARSMAFRYPLLDRVPCNETGAPAESGCSSSFSIRFWIECLAMRKYRTLAETWWCFQYPLSDRAPCNLRLRQHLVAPVLVSVSTVGSSTCNCWLASFSVRNVSLSVSTVGSSILQPCVGLTPTHGVACLQYPLLDRAPCNSRTVDRTATGPVLSVSAVGSSTLQRADDCRSRYLDPLSISALGSSTLQHLGKIEIDAGKDNFQYPLLDRVYCNHHRRCQSDARAVLSVSAP